MARKKNNLLIIFLSLLSVSLLSQSCVTAMLTAGAIKNHKQNKKKDKAIKEATDKGILDFGGYSIDNVTDEINMSEMISRLEKNNYVILNSEENNKQNVVSVQFVPKRDFYIPYYKQLSGNDFSKTQKGKCCLFKKESEWTWRGWVYRGIPFVGEVYWSGEVIDGYINGEGSGLYIKELKFSDKMDATGNFSYFEGEFVYGIPVSDVTYYDVDMNDVKKYKDIKPTTYKKRDRDFYFAEHKDKLDKAMLDNFDSGRGKQQYEKYQLLGQDVRNIIANYKSFAEDIILNDKTPPLSQDVSGESPVPTLFGPQQREFVFISSPEEQNKRHKLESFKNLEGIDLTRMDDNYKSLLLQEQKSLLNDVEKTLKYMNLLDGLSLLSTDRCQKAKGYYNVSIIGMIGYIMDTSNYWSILDNSEKVASEFKESSTGRLREKYARAEQNIKSWHKTFSDFRNSAKEEAAAQAAKHSSSSSGYSYSNSSSNENVDIEKISLSDFTYSVDKEWSEPGVLNIPGLISGRLYKSVRIKDKNGKEIFKGDISKYKDRTYIFALDHTYDSETNAILALYAYYKYGKWRKTGKN